MTREELRDISYIGDGVYIGHDGFAFWIFTSNGIEDTNFICLDVDMVGAINNYMDRIRSR